MMECNENRNVPLQIREAHFFSVSSQGNVYTISELVDENGFEKILVATLQRKIFCIEYLNCRPYMREISFPYIPSDVEIISIGAFNKSEPKDEFTVGISLVKKNENSEVVGQFLNFYSWDLTTDTSLTCISNIPLAFIPYFLHHYQAVYHNKWQTVWLLTGGDGNTHVYKCSTSTKKYEEDSCESYFPELLDTCAVVLRIDILYDSQKLRRRTVICDECGKVSLFEVDLHSGSAVVSSTQEMMWDSPTASVVLFPNRTSTDNLTDCPREMDEVNIVVANCFESSYIFTNDLTKESRHELPNANSSDVVTCCLVCDIDHDGNQEILIGTYGQTVRMYKQNLRKSWYLHHCLSVPYPILALKYIDVVGDGSKQLVVMTTDGVHIFQHDPRYVAPLIMERMKAFQKLKGLTSIETTS